MIFCKTHAYGNGGNQLKYKRLVSAGCSFIHGSELGDENPYSHKTYPALLSKHLNLQYDCIAYPGASNQGIAKKILDYSVTEGCLFLIQWTYPSRLGINLSYDYYDKHNQKQTWFDLAPDNWDLQGRFKEYNDYTQQLKDLEIDKLSSTVYKHIGNNTNFDFYTKLSIFAVKQYLDANKCEYIFTAGSNSLVNFPDILAFENLGFKEWCDVKKFKLGPYQHPLDEAHHSAFEYLCNILNM